MAEFTCPMCGKKYSYPYVHFNPNKYPKTCGSRVCETNLKWQKRHKDILTGENDTPEEIKKW